MKVRLLFPDRDADFDAPEPPQAAALTDDLRLGAVFEAMAEGDPVIARVARAAVLAANEERAVILHRQAALGEAIRQETLVRDLHALAAAALEGERGSYLHTGSRTASGAVFDAGRSLDALIGPLRRLGTIAGENRERVSSAPWRALFGTLAENLDDGLFADLQEYARISRRPEMLLTARLGAGNKGTGYTLRGFPAAPPRWRRLSAACRPIPTGSIRGTRTAPAP